MRRTFVASGLLLAVALASPALAERRAKTAAKEPAAPNAKKLATLQAKFDKVPKLPSNRERLTWTEKVKLRDGSVSITEMWRLQEKPADGACIETNWMRITKNTSVMYKTIPLSSDYGSLFIRTVVVKNPGPQLLQEAWSGGTGKQGDLESYWKQNLASTVKQIVGSGKNAQALRKGVSDKLLAALKEGSLSHKVALAEAKTIKDVPISSLPDVWKPWSAKTSEKKLSHEKRERELRTMREHLFTGYMARPAINLEQWLSPQIWTRLKALKSNQTALVFGPGMVDPESEAYLRNNDQSLIEKGITFKDQAKVYAFGLEQPTVAHTLLAQVTGGNYHYKAGIIERLKPGNGKGQIPKVDFAWSRFGPDNYAPHYHTAIKHMLGMLKEAPPDNPDGGGVLLTHTNARMKILDKNGKDVTEAYLKSIKGVKVIHFQKMDAVREFDDKGVDVGDTVAAKKRSGFGPDVKYHEVKDYCYQIGFQRTTGPVLPPALKLREKDGFISGSPPIITAIWDGKPAKS